MIESYDVVVVGAGLAGLQCARLLGASSLKVALIDGKRCVSDRVRTTGIFVRRTLEDFELPERFLGTPIRHVVLHSPSGREMHLESPYDEFRIGQIGPICRTLLENAIAAGVKWLPETRLIRIEGCREGSLLSLHTGGRNSRIGTSFVVGADGVNSAVARELGLSRNREWIVGVEEVLGGVPLNGPPEMHCYLNPRLAPGYLAWFVNDGLEAHLGVGGYTSRFRPVQALEKLKETAGAAHDLSKSRIIERRAGRIPVGGILPRIACRQGLLVGDAAGAVSPLTAGGLDPCFRLSTFAAQIIHEYLATERADVLIAYSGVRLKPKFRSRKWMRTLFKSVRNPQTMELVFGVMQSRTLRPLAKRVFFGRGSFPDLPIVFRADYCKNSPDML